MDENTHHKLDEIMEDLHEWKDEISEKIVDKLNIILKDSDFRTELKYLFEPIDSEREDIFTFNFHNPFNKKNLEIVWNSLKERIEGGSIESLLELDKEPLKEFHNALEHLEMRQRRKIYASKKLEYIDFFEDEKLFIVAIEIPNTIEENEIEIAGSPHEIEIIVGETFKKVIKIPPRINPDNALAKFEDGILEIKLQKIHKSPKTKIQLTTPDKT